MAIRPGSATFRALPRRARRRQIDVATPHGSTNARWADATPSGSTARATTPWLAYWYGYDRPPHRAGPRRGRRPRVLVGQARPRPGRLRRPRHRLRRRRPPQPRPRRPRPTRPAGSRRRRNDRSDQRALVAATLALAGSRLDEAGPPTPVKGTRSPPRVADDITQLGGLPIDHVGGAALYNAEQRVRGARGRSASSARPPASTPPPARSCRRTARPTRSTGSPTCAAGTGGRSAASPAPGSTRATPGTSCTPGWPAEDKGVPATVTDHPAVFATLTAPCFGPVHGRRRGGPVPAPP